MVLRNRSLTNIFFLANIRDGFYKIHYGILILPPIHRLSCQSLLKITKCLISLFKPFDLFFKFRRNTKNLTLKPFDALILFEKEITMFRNTLQNFDQRLQHLIPRDFQCCEVDRTVDLIDRTYEKYAGWK